MHILYVEPEGLPRIGLSLQVLHIKCAWAGGSTPTHSEGMVDGMGIIRQNNVDLEYYGQKDFGTHDAKCFLTEAILIFPLQWRYSLDFFLVSHIIPHRPPKEVWWPQSLQQGRWWAWMAEGSLPDPGSAEVTGGVTSKCGCNTEYVLWSVGFFYDSDPHIISHCAGVLFLWAEPVQSLQIYIYMFYLRRGHCIFTTLKYFYKWQDGQTRNIIWFIGFFIWEWGAGKETPGKLII